MNAKRLTPTQDAADRDSAEIEALRKSINQDGFDYAKPIEITCVGDSILILDGHKRILAAHSENLELIPCSLTI